MIDDMRLFNLTTPIPAFPLKGEGAVPLNLHRTFIVLKHSL
jgi:hypothetical protein